MKPALKLELASFPVNDVRFSTRTAYSDGVLELDKKELCELVLEDKKIVAADLDYAFPGEKTRIVNIRDVVEPRIKVSGPGCIFPGIMGPVETVGEGQTHRLSGVTVMSSVQYKPSITSGVGAPSAVLVDMWGPGSQMSPFGSTINIVLTIRLVDGISEVEAHNTIQLAEFKLADRLAQTTNGDKPASTEVFELSEVDDSLPRIVYILGALTQRSQPHTGVSFYGMPIDASLPTLVHPNELIDGVVTVDTRQGSAIFSLTWGWQNQPVAFELLREHGRSLNFLGVILQRIRFTSELGKRITATCASQMARLLGADGSINSGLNASGNAYLDLMFTVQACEKKGIKTVLITPEWASEETETPLPFYVPEACAIVSTGSHGRKLKLPGAPDKVIGINKGEMTRHMVSEPMFSPWDELSFDNIWALADSADWWGRMNYTSLEY